MTSGNGRVAVVGGGISGLAAAWELHEAGREVVLLEASDRVGGVIQTRRVGPYQFEDGPTNVRVTGNEFPSFVSELGLDDELLEAPATANLRYLYFHGRLQPLPTSFREFLRTQLLTPRQKLRVMLEPCIARGNPDHEETVAEFFGRRVGRGVTMTWVDIVVSGVYAGNPNRLGIDSAFPELRAMEQQHGSVFRAMRERLKGRREDPTRRPRVLSFKGGMTRLVDRLHERLGDQVRTGQEVDRLALLEDGRFRLHVHGPGGASEGVDFDSLVLATPALKTAMLLAPVCSEAADLTFEVESVDLVVVHAGFDADQLEGLPQGLGFLVPRCQRMRTLGWIFNSQLFPEQVPEGRIALTGMFGGSLDTQCLSVTDEQVAHLMMGELGLCLGQRKTPAPDVLLQRRWKAVIPQPNVGHARRMEAVRALVREKTDRLVLAGNWVGAITVDGCVERGRRAARELLGRGVESAS